MGPNATAANDNEPKVLCHWSARKLNLTVLLYVGAVFVAFMALSHYVFQSDTAVKSLAITAVGFLVSLVPAVLKRVEYRLTERELESRPHNTKKPSVFTSVFELDQLSHIVPTRHGFKYYRPLNESNLLLRLWKAHLSEAFSGEVHVETVDQEGVLERLVRCGVSIKR